MNNKLETLTNLFEGKEIRSIWDSDKEEYYFSVVDVINALAEPKEPRKYWNDLKVKLKNEGSELSEKIGQLKMKAKDGKMRETDTLDTEGIFRLIESVPSPKAEPFKMWLASLGKERIDEVFDPEIAINRAIEYYRKKGYTDDWISKRIKSIQDRKELTDVWKANGIEQEYEYGILTNEIYKTWSGMTAQQYKKYKGLHKESLRDNMDNLEVSLTDISEEVTKRLAQKNNPKGLEENLKVARQGGRIAKSTRDDIEELLGESVVNNKNNLNYKHTSNTKILLENKK